MPLNAADHMDHIREWWAASAARQEKPSPVWVVIPHDGQVVGWGWSRAAAEKCARLKIMNCHIARLDPRDF